jgi:membrane-bound lytic murein transglycosylase MltF
MAAQGYQESRLDQEARSPVGAIGIMQVMPATGHELKVGDITLLEPNIHAGVKYSAR